MANCEMTNCSSDMLVNQKCDRKLNQHTWTVYYHHSQEKLYALRSCIKRCNLFGKFNRRKSTCNNIGTFRFDAVITLLLMHEDMLYAVFETENTSFLSLCEWLEMITKCRPILMSNYLSKSMLRMGEQVVMGYQSTPVYICVVPVWNPINKEIKLCIKYVSNRSRSEIRTL